ncbi:MAG: SRPBCC family protein [Rhizobiaceae bacterium]
MKIIEETDGAKRALARLLAERKRGYSLAAPFYLDNAVFDLDMDGIFARHWFHIGSAPEVSKKGDYFTVEIGRYSIIVTRGEDMEIRAFHNVCRHRGARILTEARGSTRKFVCRYHNWTYGLSGTLDYAEHMAPHADPKCLGLKPVHLRNVAGVLFACLADEPPEDFAELERTAVPYIAPHRLEDCKVAKQIDLVEDGNWKAVMENNRECYHCTRHPELLKTFFQFFGHSESDVKPRQQEYYERYRRIQGEFEAIWGRNGLQWKAVERLDEDKPTPYRVERMALDNAGESYTMDTRIASKHLLGDFTEKRLGALSLHTQPNSWNHFLSDHAVIFSVFPMSAEKTLVRTTWLVHKDAVEGVDYDMENLTHVWNKTNEQDATFVAWTQMGVRSPAYEPGPYTPNESQLELFLDWYVSRMNAYVGGPALRAPVTSIPSARRAG